MKNLKEHYLFHLNLLNTGVFDSTIEFLNDLRSSLDRSAQAEAEVVRRLLSYRVQLLFGNQSPKELLEGLQNWSIENNFYQGELELLQGFICFHDGNFEAGTLYFQKAKNRYHIEDIRRMILALFNQFIGQLNMGRIPLEKIESELTLLERLSREYEEYNVLGFVLRQRGLESYYKGQFREAQSVLEESKALLIKYGTHADFNLVKILLGITLFKLNERSSALSEYRSIVPPIENRVQFPLYILGHLLGEVQSKSLELFPVVTPHWQQIYRENLKSPVDERLTLEPVLEYEWNLRKETIHIFSKCQSLGLKRNSIEGQIVLLLVKTPQRTMDLLERLWPNTSVDPLGQKACLHQAIRRLKKKIPDLAFDNGVYRIPTGCIRIS